MALLENALQFAHRSHLGQTRQSGEPYINHPVRVMYRLKSFDMPQSVLVSALLHDILEDCEQIKVNDLEEVFGEYIAGLVKYLSKPPSGVRNRIPGYYHQLSQAAIQHPELLMIKMCDQLDNLQSLWVFDAEKRERKIREVQELSIPIYEQALDRCMPLQMRQAFHQLLSALKIALQQELTLSKLDWPIS